VGLALGYKVVKINGFRGLREVSGSRSFQPQGYKPRGRYSEKVAYDFQPWGTNRRLPSQVSEQTHYIIHIYDVFVPRGTKTEAANLRSR
jgi:hypothetical protein